jgi:hypothetical protein
MTYKPPGFMGVLDPDNKNGALSTRPLVPLESTHTKLHKRTRNLLTKHGIVEMATRVLPARPAGRILEATRINFRQTSEP